MNANQVMLQIAAQLAEKNGFQKTGSKTILAVDDDFWGNRSMGVSDPELQVQSETYEKPDWNGDPKKEYRPKISIDMHWGNPRLCVHLSADCFCCLTYDRTSGKLSSVQASGEDGLSLCLEISKQIRNLIVA